MNKIDVIIPVYRGLAETKACINSVLAAKNETAFELIIINDASPEAEIVDYLNGLTPQPGRISVLHNKQNQGFVVTCNRGLALHPDRDVVLLNSDTEVCDGWLDRLARCAHAPSQVGQPQIASVTPFSNNATLASYPRFCQANDLPANLTLAELDALFMRLHSGKSLEIPTGVGFCMYMRRAAIDAIGNFDEAAFGLGYGEENDWCMRASAAGYRHLLCADTFVYHRGEVSFGAGAYAKRQQAQQVIDSRYPHYPQRIAEHLQQDPARPLRRAVDLARLAGSSLPRLLLVTHHWGGGVERHIQDLIKLAADRAEVLVLRPHDADTLSLTWARPGEAFVAYFNAHRDFAQLIDFLRPLALSRIHIHHIHGLPADILTLSATLGVPLDVTLHDHFPLTPAYHLAEGGGGVCAGGQEVAHPWGWAMREWQSAMHAFLARAERLICPSEYLASQITTAFPDLHPLVWAHPEAHLSPVRPIKVLVLGRITATKGLHVVADCARDAKARGLPLFFTILGPTVEAVPTFPELPIRIHGSYDDQDLAALMALERADVVLFPSQIPESYSYTLTVALDSGLPIVASRLGAFIERLTDRANAALLPWHSAPRQWNDSLMTLAASGQHLPAPAHEAISAYRDRYLSALMQPKQPEQPGQPGGGSALGDGYYFPPVAGGTGKEYTLAELYVAGIENGEAEAKREFKRRAMQIEPELAAARQSSINAHLALQQRDDEYQQSQRTLQAEYQRYEVLQQQAEATAQRFHLLEQHQQQLLQDIDLLEENRFALLHHRDSLEQELADTRQVLMESRQILERERDAARAAFDEVVRSRSWKITAPLRRSVQVLKSLRHRGRDLRANTRRLPQQVALASQILKQEGPQALTRRVYEKLTRRREWQPAIQPGTAPALYKLQAAIGPLTVPAAAAPRFSIIIPVYGQHLLTYTCLHSIAATCAHEAIEVIVIDDCSPEPAALALREVAGVTIVRNDTNLGFLRNCNKAAQLARGEYIVLLNNDTIATGDWLRQMQAVFAREPDAGLVGVKLIYPDGKLQEAGGIVWRDGSAWNLGRDGDPDRPEYNFLREVDYCSGACLMMPRDFWLQLGGFDEIYAPAYYEDTDLAFRVRQAGRRVFYQPRAVVVHFEGKSSGTDLTQGIKRYQVINHETFVKRWREVLSAHRLNGMAPHLERERYPQPRVLVIDACMLTPDQDSGSLRMFEMLGILRRMGCKVTFFADNLEYREPYTQQIQDLGVEVLYHPYHSYMTELLTQVAADFDAIIVSRVTVACKYVDLIRQVAPKARLIFDTVDLHFLRQERQAALTPDPVLQAAAAAMKQQELQIMAQSDITLVVSPVEKALLADLVPDVRVGIVSNIHQTMPGPAGFAERSGILFIGGFRHPPNLDAINWYVENVLPILRHKQPGLVTTIIGSNAPPALQKFAADDFVIAGFVPDVTPYYHQARLSISPLRYGAGVKGKVNLSMQYGVPVVATPMSVEGMFLTDGENVMVADTPEDFANAIIHAHNDAALWQKLARGGLDNIEQHFSRRCAERALREVLPMVAGASAKK